MSETSHLQESSVHYNIPELQSAPGRPPPPHPQSHSNAHLFPHPLSLAHPQPNGQHFSVALHREASGTREDLSGPDDSEEEADEEEEEAPASKWQGIESIFEAYQEYVEGKQLQTRRDADTGLITLGCLRLFSPVIYGGFITSSFEKDISISFYRFIIQCFPIFLGGGGGSFHLKSVCWLELDLICNCCCVR